MSRWIPRELRSHAFSLVLLSAAFLVGRAAGTSQNGKPVIADELRCRSFVLVDERSEEPLLRIGRHQALGSWGVFLMDSKGRECAQLLVSGHDGNPQLMFLDEDCGDPELPSLGYRPDLSLVGEDSEPSVSLYAKGDGHDTAELAVLEQGGRRTMGSGVDLGHLKAGGTFFAITSEGEVFKAP